MHENFTTLLRAALQEPPRWRRWRSCLYLEQPSITVDGRTWRSHRPNRRIVPGALMYGYRRGQVRQLLAAIEERRLAHDGARLRAIAEDLGLTPDAFEPAPQAEGAPPLPPQV